MRVLIFLGKSSIKVYAEQCYLIYLLHPNEEDPWTCTAPKETGLVGNPANNCSSGDPFGNCSENHAKKNAYFELHAHLDIILCICALTACNSIHLQVLVGVLNEAQTSTLLTYIDNGIMRANEVTVRFLCYWISKYAVVGANCLAVCLCVHKKKTV